MRRTDIEILEAAIHAGRKVDQNRLATVIEQDQITPVIREYLVGFFRKTNKGGRPRMAEEVSFREYLAPGTFQRILEESPELTQKEIYTLVGKQICRPTKQLKKMAKELRPKVLASAAVRHVRKEHPGLTKEELEKKARKVIADYDRKDKQRKSGDAPKAASRSIIEKWLNKKYGKGFYTRHKAIAGIKPKK